MTGRKTPSYLLVLLRKIIECLLFLRLSPWGDWCCDVLGSVPTGSVLSSHILHIFWDASHCWWVALPASPSDRLCSSTPACPGQCIHRSLRRWMLNNDTSQSTSCFLLLFSHWVSEVLAICCYYLLGIDSMLLSLQISIVSSVPLLPVSFWCLLHCRYGRVHSVPWSRWTGWCVWR